MSEIGHVFQRFLAMILTATLITTGLPEYVFAAEPVENQEVIDEISDAEENSVVNDFSNNVDETATDENIPDDEEKADSDLSSETEENMELIIDSDESDQSMTHEPMNSHFEATSYTVTLPSGSHYEIIPAVEDSSTMPDNHITEVDGEYFVSETGDYTHNTSSSICVEDVVDAGYHIESLTAYIGGVKAEARHHYSKNGLEDWRSVWEILKEDNSPIDANVTFKVVVARDNEIEIGYYDENGQKVNDPANNAYNYCISPCNENDSSNIVEFSKPDETQYTYYVKKDAKAVKVYIDLLDPASIKSITAKIGGVDAYVTKDNYSWHAYYVTASQDGSAYINGNITFNVQLNIPSDHEVIFEESNTYGMLNWYGGENEGNITRIFDDDEEKYYVNKNAKEIYVYAWTKVADATITGLTATIGGNNAYVTKLEGNVYRITVNENGTAVINGDVKFDVNVELPVYNKYSFEIAGAGDRSCLCSVDLNSGSQSPRPRWGYNKVNQEINSIKNGENVSFKPFIARGYKIKSVTVGNQPLSASNGFYTLKSDGTDKTITITTDYDGTYRIPIKGELDNVTVTWGNDIGNLDNSLTNTSNSSNIETHYKKDVYLKVVKKDGYDINSVKINAEGLSSTIEGQPIDDGSALLYHLYEKDQPGDNNFRIATNASVTISTTTDSIRNLHLGVDDETNPTQLICSFDGDPDKYYQVGLFRGYAEDGIIESQCDSVQTMYPNGTGSYSIPLDLWYLSSEGNAYYACKVKEFSSEEDTYEETDFNTGIVSEFSNIYHYDPNGSLSGLRNLRWDDETKMLFWDSIPEEDQELIESINIYCTPGPLQETSEYNEDLSKWINNNATSVSFATGLAGKEYDGLYFDIQISPKNKFRYSELNYSVVFTNEEINACEDGKVDLSILPSGAVFIDYKSAIGTRQFWLNLYRKLTDGSLEKVNKERFSLRNSSMTSLTTWAMKESFKESGTYFVTLTEGSKTYKSEDFEFTKNNALPAPTNFRLETVNGHLFLRWDQVEGNNGYAVHIINHIDQYSGHGAGSELPKDQNELYIDYWYHNHNLGAGYWSIEVVTLSDDINENNTSAKGRYSHYFSDLTLIPAKSLSISPATATLYTGDGEFPLTVSVLPENHTFSSIYWSSSNPAVATVTLHNDGTVAVNPVGKGTATITAKDTSGTNLTAKCTVTVKERLLTSVSLNQSTASLYKGDVENTVVLTAYTEPYNAFNSELTWSTSNANVAKVTIDPVNSHMATVTSAGVGTATITATAKDGSKKSATCVVTVADNAYNISYNLNGGKNHEDNPLTYTIGSTTNLESPQKIGYEFVGWYESSDFSGDPVVAIGTDYRRNVTLYAKWAAKDINITLNANGGSVEDAPTKVKTVKYGLTYGTALSEPVYAGYDFVGWYTLQTGGRLITDTTPVSELQDHILYAHWEAAEYPVTYEVGAHGTAPANSKARYASLVFKPSDPTAEGWRFDGWYKEASCTNAWNFAVDTMPARALTIYAKWIKTNKLSIDLNGGSLYEMEYMTMNVDESDPRTIQALFASSNHVTLANDQASPDTKPSKTKYEFVKWNTKADGTGNDVDITTATVTENTNLYAQWEIADAYKAATPEWSVVSPEQLKSGVNGGNDAEVCEDASIKLTTETSDAQIWYRTKNSGSWTQYTDAVKIADIPEADRTDVTAASFKVKIYAKATKYAGGDSEEKTITLTVCKTVADWGEVLEEDRSGNGYNYTTAADVPAGFWVANLAAFYPYKGNAYNFNDGKDDDDIRVYYGKKLLINGTDYTIAYSNSVNAYELAAGEDGYNASKAPKFTVTGKGNYAGTLVKTFKINRLSIYNAIVETSDIHLKENGKEQKPGNTITYALNGKNVTLKANTDYTLTYEEGENAFKNPRDEAYVVTVEGKGNYVTDADPSKKLTYNVFIEPTTLNLLTSLTFTVKEAQYSGEPVDPSSITVKNGKTELAENDIVKVADKASADALFAENNDDLHLIAYYLENNTAVGTGKITFIGNEERDYVGSVTKSFAIQGITLTTSNTKFIDDKETPDEADDVAYSVAGYPYKNYVFDGKAHKQNRPEDPNADGNPYGEGTLYYNFGKADQHRLVENTDYTVAYSVADPTNVGTYTVTYTGIGGFTGTLSKTYKIEAFNFADDAKKESDKQQIILALPGDNTYLKGGATPKPNVRLVTERNEDGSVKETKLLKEGDDYTVSYSNNKKVYTDATFTEKNAPTITIKGKGNYTKEKAFKFLIHPSTNTDELSIKAADKAFVNKKGNFTTSVIVKDADGLNLVANTDYYNYNDKNHPFVYSYAEDTNMADGTVRAADSIVDANDIVPAGTLLKVTVTLKETGNYRNLDGTALTKTGYFRIVGQDISKASIKVNQQYFTGTQICPDKNQIVVTVNGNVLADQDYEIVSYENNINKGTAKITIKGVGAYGGERTGTFSILVKPAAVTISFNANRATSGTMTNMTLAANKTYTLTANKFKRKNYTFIRWNTKPDGSGQDFINKETDITAADVLALAPDGLLILYAQWEPETFSITYHTNGGISAERNAEFNPYTEYTSDSSNITIVAPPREDWPVGYQFGGWYTEDTYKNRISVIRTGTSGNLNLYAKWIPYTYSVTFDANTPSGDYDAKTNGTMATETFSYGVPKGLLKNAYKVKDYVFMGWSWEPDADEATYDDTEIVCDLMEPCNNIDQSMTLYAVWGRDFNITYEPNGGEMPEDVLIEGNWYPSYSPVYRYGEGLAARELPVPTMEGHAFGGWFKDPAFKSKLTSIGKTVSGNLILYAKWTPYNYKIAFDGNGSKAEPANGKMNALSATYLTKPVTLTANAFTRKGYAFGGWNTEPDGSGVFFENCEENVNLIPDRNNASIKLYAMWDPVDEYTLTFVLNGGELENDYVTQDNQLTSYTTYEPGTAVNLAQKDWEGNLIYTPVRTGYTFNGWFKDETLKSQVKTLAASTNSDATLYAKWTPISFKVSFNGNLPDGVPAGTKLSGNMRDLSMKYDTAVKLTANAFTLPGYRFNGWNTAKNGGGYDFEDEAEIIDDFMPDSSKTVITLYAQWTETDDYIVGFNTNGGEFNDPDEINATVNGDRAETDPVQIDTVLNLYDDDISVYAQKYIPVKEGYDFAGWYQDQKLAKKVMSVSYASFNRDVELYAKWKAKTYKVKFIADEPEGMTASGRMADAIMTWGTQKALSKIGYTLKGYTFMGWSVTNYAVRTAGMDDAAKEAYNLNHNDVLDAEIDFENLEKVESVGNGYANEVSLYAVWRKDTYAIVYNNVVFDNSGNPQSYTISDVTAGAAGADANGNIVLKAPYSLGDTFLGWYSDAKFTKKVTSIPAGSTGNKVLYAKWAKTQYTINYNLNCGNDPVLMDTSKVGYITSYDAEADHGYLLPTAERDGYIFGGWFKEATCKTAVGPIISSPYVDMTVYAKWVPED